MNAQSKIDASTPLDGFPAHLHVMDTSNIADFGQLSQAMFTTYLNIRALAWMQNTIAQIFVEPRDSLEPFDNARIDLFMTASDIITRVLVEQAEFINNLNVQGLAANAVISKKARP